ncbi:hypothetical protein E2C01_080907 [Portunus trituberculatus]|uniref:Uncharacterized protein n=1 Tax=Portunus trituberculatus TaxID=210409 RepID=A0A5B7IQK6_PORTR|nr:hypothetical protein [Portunus trituberculatus]
MGAGETPSSLLTHHASPPPATQLRPNQQTGPHTTHHCYPGLPHLSHPVHIT